LGKWGKVMGTPGDGRPVTNTNCNKPNAEEKGEREDRLPYKDLTSSIKKTPKGEKMR